MSSSGSRYSFSRSDSLICAASASAALRDAVTYGFSGTALSVSHSAAAAAPAREHSRLISPRCSSSDVKYVYGLSWAYRRPTPGSANRTAPHPYGWRPCLCGSMTIESASPIARMAAGASSSSVKKPPYAASTWMRTP